MFFQILVAMAPTGIPRVHEIGIDVPVLLFTLAITLLSSLLFGSIPIFKYAGVKATTGLRGMPLSPWTGLGVLALWASGTLLAGGLLLRLRDA